jgi:hypothetical protein
MWPGLRRRCRAVVVEPDGQLNEVLYEHTRWGIFMTRHESGEVVDRLVVVSEDMMKFKTVKFFLKHSYLLATCHHVGVTVLPLPHGLVYDKLGFVTDVKPFNPILRGDAQAVDEGLIFHHIVVKWNGRRIT